MQPVFIDGQSGPLFSVLYPPVNQPIVKAILHVPAFAEEMNKSRRMVALQAKALSEQGYAVLILDLFGTGDSAGDFGDATWQIWLQDINSAVAWLRQQGAQTIDLWAVRLGALLAMDFISQGQQDIGRLVCWQPVLNGDTFITQFLRLRIAAAMMDRNAPQEKTSELKQQLLAGQAIEVAGYLLNPNLINPILSLQPNALDLSELREVLVFEITSSVENAASVPTAKFVEMQQDKNQQVILKTVVGSPFWSTQEISEVPGLLVETVNSLA